MKYNLKDIKNLKEILITSYLFIMSLLIICIFIYLRIIIKRSTYSLDLLKNNVDFTYFLINSTLICVHLLGIITILYTLLKKTKNKNILLNFLQKLMEYILWKPLNYFLDLISPHIPYSGTFILNYAYFFRKNLFRIFIMKMLCFIFYFLPKIIMSIIFFVEILYYHRLELFIKNILVLLIPIIYLIFLNLSEKFYTNNIVILENILIITPKGIPNNNGVYTTHEFKLKKNSGYNQESLEELSESWNILFYILNLNQITRLFISQLYPYITLLTSSLYLISFSYKLYYLVML